MVWRLKSIPRLLHATHNADGNVMIHNVLLLVIPYASDQSVKFIVKRLHVLHARFIVISHNVMCVVLRICAKVLIAPSVKPYVHQQSVVLLVPLLMPSAHLCARRPSAIGSARSQPSALVLSANSCARSQLVKLSSVSLLH